MDELERARWALDNYARYVELMQEAGKQPLSRQKLRAAIESLERREREKANDAFLEP